MTTTRGPSRSLQIELYREKYFSYRCSDRSDFFARNHTQVDIFKHLWDWKFYFCYTPGIHGTGILTYLSCLKFNHMLENPIFTHRNYVGLVYDINSQWRSSIHVGKYTIHGSLVIQSPSENAFMKPKYYAFRFGDWTHQPSSENMTIDAYGMVWV